MRKPWTQKEDSCLKKLREELNVNKWSDISKQMAEQFGIVGRSQKQCRERYHNHLDSEVKNKKLTQEREIAFFRAHDEIGNKWSSIASHFPGVSDNYLKNIMHSKLRGAIRKLNRQTKDTRDNLNADFKLYPLEIVYRIIESCEKNRGTQQSNESQRAFCLGIKNKLLEYNGGMTFHCHFDGYLEMEIYRELMSELRTFEFAFRPGATNTKAPHSAIIEESKTINVQATDCNDEHKGDASLILSNGQEEEEQVPETQNIQKKSSFETSDSCEIEGKLTRCSKVDVCCDTMRASKTRETSNNFLDILCMEEESYVKHCFSQQEADEHLELLPMPFSSTLQGPLDFGGSADSFSH